MSDDDRLTLDDCIKEDFESIKKELMGLTNRERCIILEEYIKKVKDYDIGIVEYQKFLRLFDKLLEEEG